MSDEDLAYHILSARNIGQNEYHHSQLHYLHAIKIRRKQLAGNPSIFEKSEYFVLMAEYLDFMARHFLPNNPLIARKLSILALKFIGTGKRICQDNDRIKVLSEAEHKLLMKIIEFFGCILPETYNHYAIKCPIIIKGRIGTNYTSTTIIHKNPTCSVCQKSFISCGHRSGVTYGDVSTTFTSDKSEILDLSLVDKPDYTHAKINILYLPKDFLESKMDQKLLNEKKEGAGLYCYHCRVSNFTPEEITPELFDYMQSPESDIDNKKYEKAEDIPIYFSSFLFDSKSGIDPKSLFKTEVCMYKQKNKFAHIPSDSLGVDPFQG